MTVSPFANFIEVILPLNFVALNKNLKYNEFSHGFVKYLLNCRWVLVSVEKLKEGYTIV